MKRVMSEEEKMKKRRSGLNMPRARLDPLGFLLSRIFYDAIIMTKMLDL
jgi:hypothetical protein